MKVLYVPFNNRGLGVDTYEESGFMQELLEQAERSHIKDDEQGLVFLYLSEVDNGFLKIFSKKKWPAWLAGVHVHVCRKFDQDEADTIANTLALDVAEDVIVFRPILSGSMTEQEIESTLEDLRDTWGWAYLAPVERIQ